MEAVKINIIGTNNVLTAAIEEGVVNASMKVTKRGYRYFFGPNQYLRPNDLR